MLQFVNKIGVKNGFVDLHNHTDQSYGEERNLMNISPADLLDSALQYSQQNGDACVTFAITDHNNFESVFEVKQKIAENPELYKNIRFIKGCEFSCGGSSFGKIVDEKGNKHRMIKGFHVLAYNFDENNKKLQFVTKLYDDSFEKIFVRDSVNVSSGRYILSLRNLLHEDGIYAPLEIFYDVDLNTNGKVQSEFVSTLLNLCKEKLNLSDEYCQNLYSKLFSTEFYKTFKVDALELAEVVEEAGGCIVLAHPKLVAFAKSYERIYASSMPQKKSNFEQVKFVIKNLKNFVSPYTGKKVRGLVGMEVLHSTSFDFSKSFEKLLQIAKDNSLYITCGSDSHGSYSLPYFSEVFPKRFSMGLGFNIMAANKNLFADRICNNTLKDNYTCDLPFEKQVKIVEASNKDDSEMTLEQILERNNATIERKQSNEKNNTPKNEKKNTKSKVKPVIKNKNKQNKSKKNQNKNHDNGSYPKFIKNRKRINTKKIYEGMDDSYLPFEKTRKRKVDPDQSF